MKKTDFKRFVYKNCLSGLLSQAVEYSKNFDKKKA